MYDENYKIMKELNSVVKCQQLLKHMYDNFFKLIKINKKDFLIKWPTRFKLSSNQCISKKKNYY